MKSINFNTGVKTYALNGDAQNTISINVADQNLPARIEAAEQKLDAVFEKLRGFDVMTAAERAALDREVKEIFDMAFNAEISKHAFGETSCFTPLADGTLLLQAFFDAFVPVVLADAEKEQTAFAKKSAKKMEQYIAAAQSVEPEEKGE